MSMRGTPQDYAKSLKLQAEKLLEDSRCSVQSDDHPKRDRYSRCILARTSDLVASCSLFVEGTNAVAGQIIMRSMIEDLIRILWATLDESNAEHLMVLGVDEVKRALRANLQSRAGRVMDREGNDRSEQLLRDSSLSASIKKKTVETMAREAGAIDLYNAFYRFISLQTHGNLLDAPSVTSPLEISAVLSGAGAISKATGHVGVRWLLRRERPNNNELHKVLGFL